jgi:hypothetical protein
MEFGFLHVACCSSTNWEKILYANGMGQSESRNVCDSPLPQQQVSIVKWHANWESTACRQTSSAGRGCAQEVAFSRTYLHALTGTTAEVRRGVTGAQV